MRRIRDVKAEQLLLSEDYPLESIGDAEQCGLAISTSAGDYVCTRDSGHTGVHAAHVVLVGAIWD